MPRTRTGRVIARLRQIVFGRRLANEEEVGERLSKTKALAIFSSDAISSSAYATEEILRVLVIAGAGALFLSVHVAIAIALLLAVVSISYRQVCRAYPNGGGAYIVARTNLAPIFGLIAAAGPVSGAEMEHAFNLGIGMVAVVAASDEASAVRVMRERGVPAWRLGDVRAGSRSVSLTGQYAGTYRA